ncbi:MAG: PatB family C-S lyase [Acidobacteriota bacterium]
MSQFDFDRPADRRRSDSVKWGAYAEEVIPLWVADMDFPAPPPVVEALHRRVDHGIFGYSMRPVALAETVAERLDRLYGWKVAAEAVTFLPGVVPGFNLAARALAKPGGELLIQTPVYPPFLTVAAHAGMSRRVNVLQERGGSSWEIDFESLASSLGNRTACFLLCNPHNPVGRVFRQDELSTLAELCLGRGIPVISDEIHCDLVFRGHSHIPFASLAPEVERATITLMAPSKTFNIPGLECAFAVIPDTQLRRRFEEARAGLVPVANLLGCAAALAAYRDAQPWLAAALNYLEANRDIVFDFCRTRMPGITLAMPEGTYLAWLDCRQAGLNMDTAAFFLQRGRVALSAGPSFGPGGDGFVRLNFGCPRSLLAEALERMSAALNRNTQ